MIEGKSFFIRQTDGSEALPRTSGSMYGAVHLILALPSSEREPYDTSSSQINNILCKTERNARWLSRVSQFNQSREAGKIIMIKFWAGHKANNVIDKMNHEEQNYHRDILRRGDVGEKLNDLNVNEITTPR